MLGKQAWWFLQWPNALVTRVFKARHFPRCDFFDSHLGHNPSFAWRSLWSTRELLKQGTRCYIGAGNSIPVWGAPWVRSPHHPSSIPVPPQGALELTVKDLWTPQLKEWNEPLIRMLFSPQQVDAILATPLLSSVEVDACIWSPHPSGNYSVRSAYHMAMNQMTDTSHLRVEGDWTYLWKLNIPPRVKVFLWRASRNCLPTRTKLQCRGVQCPNLCVTCNNDLETTWHTFIMCPKASACWNCQGLGEAVANAMLNSDSFSGWCFMVLRSITKEQGELFALTLWSLWRARNNLLWENIDTPVMTICCRAGTMHGNWQLARRCHPDTGDPRPPPPPNSATMV